MRREGEDRVERDSNLAEKLHARSAVQSCLVENRVIDGARSLMVDYQLRKQQTKRRTYTSGT